jgi:hypothetical protein
MELMEKEIRLYKNIHFCNRYEILSKAYQFEERLNYSNDKVIELISSLGYKVKYIKSDNFFKIQDTISNIKFYLHICLKYSNIELIIGATNIDTDEFITGSVFVRLYRIIKYAEGIVLDENIKDPKFRTYEDLQEILKETFSIYEDFKKEVIKEYESKK